MGSKRKRGVLVAFAAIALVVFAYGPPVHALDSSTRAASDHRDLHAHRIARWHFPTYPELSVRTVVAYRPSVSGGSLDPDVIRVIEDIPNRVKFQVSYEQRDDPSFPGRWGSYDQALNTVFIGDKTRGRLDVIRYAVDHETAHAFYWQVLTDAERATVDRTLAVPRGVDPKEGFADCVAKLWGSPSLYAYWDCPAEAVAYLQGIVNR
jgi:hypothetical protein